jgi:hypothetical protein
MTSATRSVVVFYCSTFLTDIIILLITVHTNLQHI